MKTEYLYVIVDPDGGCRQILRGIPEKASLPGLLAEGWRPLRETAFAQTQTILICLEREPEGPSGFGFGH